MSSQYFRLIVLDQYWLPTPSRVIIRSLASNPQVSMPILHQYHVSTRNPTTVLTWYRASSKFPPLKAKVFRMLFNEKLWKSCRNFYSAKRMTESLKSSMNFLTTLALFKSRWHLKKVSLINFLHLTNKILNYKALNAIKNQYFCEFVDVDVDLSRLR